MSTLSSSGVRDDITQCIGNTPLVRLGRIAEGCAATVLAEIENLNPLWSVKDRIGLAMIEGHGEAITADWLASASWTVDVNGAEYPATTSLRPLYDPTSRRIRA